MSKILSKTSKADEDYKNLAATGSMVSYPVSINGKTHNPSTGTHYHSTIKLLNPSKEDEHSSAHRIAYGANMHPPDPEKTFIDTAKFKTRNGHDIHVITFHGPEAEKIKEHNKKFAGLGYKEAHEYHPHLSVSPETWNDIKNKGHTTAKEAGISFGHPDLRHGKSILASYGPKTKKLASSEPTYTSLAKGANGDWKKEGYKISHKEHGNAINVSAHDKNNKKVGSVNIYPHENGSNLVANDLGVDLNHQRKGLATAMYRHAEKTMGMPLHPEPEEGRNRTPNGKAFWKQKNRPFGKSEELAKGSQQRKNPFNPTKVSPSMVNKLDAWQNASANVKPGPREDIPEMSGPERTRAVHKLHNKTQARVNPMTNEREFLLHRGMSEAENLDTVRHGKYSHHDKMSSWTPIHDVARYFARSGNEWRKDMSGNPADKDLKFKGDSRADKNVISAWVPESKIHSIPNQYGSADQEFRDESGRSSPNERAYEHEVIVKPGIYDHHNYVMPIPKTKKLASSEKVMNSLAKSMTPQIMRETIALNQDLLNLHGKALMYDGEVLLNYIEDNNLKKSLQEKHLSRLTHHFGDNLALLALAINSGIEKAYKKKQGK